MVNHLPSMQKLIRSLQRVPYLASKNVYKVAAYFLKSDDKTLETLCAVILEAKKKIQPCVHCFNWTETGDVCWICANPKRDQTTVCVVETWHDLCALEAAGHYQGVYHVLGGALCPLEGVGPDQLTIEPLVKRIEGKGVTELIFATNATPEGEATASLIWSRIKLVLADPSSLIRVSKLASGVPIGSSLEYMDRVTLGKALLGRQPF